MIWNDKPIVIDLKELSTNTPDYSKFFGKGKIITIVKRKSAIKKGHNKRR